MNFFVCSIGLGGIIALIVLALCVAGAGIFCFWYFPIKVWFKCYFGKTPVKLMDLMSVKTNLQLQFLNVVDSYAFACKSDLKLTLCDIEALYTSGANPNKVLQALVNAKLSGIKLNLSLAKAIDLAGKDVVNVVKECTTPKIVETDTVSAVSRDGIQLKIKANITLKTNLGRVIGGADYGTIIARVSEAISSVVGSSVSHKAVLENPDIISDTIMDKGLDYGTAYEIVSLDIYDIAIGDNMAVKLELQQAEIVERAKKQELEQERLKAVILEQENKAKYQESLSKKVEAETEVPLALAKALKEGKISPTDYYDIKNLEADTHLRNVLSGEAKPTANNISKQNKMPRPRPNPFDF